MWRPQKYDTWEIFQKKSSKYLSFAIKDNIGYLILGSIIVPHGCLHHLICCISLKSQHLTISSPVHTAFPLRPKISLGLNNSTNGRPETSECSPVKSIPMSAGVPWKTAPKRAWPRSSRATCMYQVTGRVDIGSWIDDDDDDDLVMIHTWNKLK